MPDRTPSLLLGQVRHQCRTLLRTPRALTTGIALPVVLLLLSGTSRGHLDLGRLGGFAVLGTTMTAWTTHGIALVAAREAGVLKRWRATPLPPWCYFAGRMIATVLVAVLAGAVTVLTGVAWFRAHADPAGLAVVVAVLALGAIACAAPATALTGFVPDVAGAFPVLGLSYLPVVVFSGALSARTNDPDWLATVASYLPVQPLVAAAHDALGHASVSMRDVAVLAIWAGAGLLAARITFRWMPRSG